VDYQRGFKEIQSNIDQLPKQALNKKAGRLYRIKQMPEAKLKGKQLKWSNTAVQRTRLRRAANFRSLAKVILIKQIIMRETLRAIFISSFTLVLWACSSPTELYIQETYTPLSIGDQTQIINLADSSTFLFSIVGTTSRDDGENVYIGTYEYSMVLDTLIFYNTDTLYFLISDGYFKTTTLHDVDSNSIYFEQRIGKPFPKDGDTWTVVDSLYYSDYMVAEKYEYFMTFFGNAEETFAFKSYEYDGYPLQTYYYGKNIGWIGTSNSSSEVVQLCSYKKINNKVYGKRWPAKPLKYF